MHKRTSVSVDTEVLPKTLKEIREWKNGTVHPQDDFIVNGIFLDVLMKELAAMQKRIAVLEAAASVV
jgi:hypothetical protein